MVNIRQFQADDLAALYRITLATGLAGGDASHLYADPSLIGHIYAAPYALLEPGLRFLEERTGIPVLGVLPYQKSLGIPQEAVDGFAKTLDDAGLWKMDWYVPGVITQK